MKNVRNSERFRKLSGDLLRTIWRVNPVEATTLGIHDYDHTLGDVSETAFRHYASALKSFVGDLESRIDLSSLSREEATDYRVVMSIASTYHLRTERLRPWVNNPCGYPSLCLWGCFGLLIHDDMPPEEKVRNVLSRMQEIPETLAVARDNIKNPPSIFVQVAMDIVASGLGFFRYCMPKVAAEHPVLEKDILKANDAVIASFESYGRWLRESLLPSARGDFAIGEDTYGQLLYAEHYLTFSPQEILRLGSEALAETEEKIHECASRIDPSVPWQELVARLKQDHPSRGGLKDAYLRAFQDARRFILERDLVTIPEGEQLDVRDTPAFERSITPYAAYFPAAPFGTDKRGQFWVTPINEDAPEARQREQLLGHCRYGIPVIALHEAYPGHHVQLVRALEVSSPVRRQIMSNLFMEGWALYCEEMMYEQGFYTDPRVRLFQLKTTMWRACRVLIDVGLHTGRMSFDDAVKMLMEKALLEEVNAIAEVKRYTMTPTQPMTYVIGKLLVLDLRERMMRKMGRRFDLKAFHDQFLSYGSIPPPLVAERMLDGRAEGDSDVRLKRTA